MLKYPCAAITGLVLVAGLCTAGEKPELPDENDRINYSLGYQIGGDLKRQHVEVNSEMLLRGIEDAMSDAKPLLGEDEMHRTLVELKRKVVALQAQAQAAAQQKNLQAGEDFLAENAKHEGVVTLPSGLQYRVLETGSGRQPSATDTVSVHYRGTLIDGTEFDSSYSRNKPATFRADRVIPGWREALQLMPEGAKWELFIPAKLAYGPRSVGKIPPNSTLVFEVQLLEVNEK
ncbi:MAG TPA: FKBP-type peptidyl-prolyl cis-trans isomerase [Gammaproteobacteria bacterium]|nr:FKBP-type peptidyl-prolyl cis-trans isomerase [Gammaproteobacteria bacterium]